MDVTPPRRGRPPKDAGNLSRQVIVSAAIALIDSDGVDAVSMRAVARLLSVDPKSLYHYVNGKEDLLDAVAESLLLTIEVPEPVGDLRTDLLTFARAFRERTLVHPRAAPLLLQPRVRSAGALRPVEAVFSVLLTTGIDADEAVHLLRSLLATLLGALLREIDASSSPSASHPESRRTAALRATDLPAIQAYADALVRYDPDSEFEYVLGLAVDSVLARIEQLRA